MGTWKDENLDYYNQLLSEEHEESNDRCDLVDGELIERSMTYADMFRLANQRLDRHEKILKVVNQ